MRFDMVVCLYLGSCSPSKLSSYSVIITHVHAAVRLIDVALPYNAQ